MFRDRTFSQLLELIITDRGTAVISWVTLYNYVCGCVCILASVYVCEKLLEPDVKKGLFLCRFLRICKLIAHIVDKRFESLEKCVQRNMFDTNEVSEDITRLKESFKYLAQSCARLFVY